MDEKIIELAKKLVEKRLASNYEEAIILAEKFTKIDMKYDYDNSFIEEKNIEKTTVEQTTNEIIKDDQEKIQQEETYIIGETEEETLKNSIEGIKTIKIYENIKLVKKTYGFNNTRELLKETTISNSINKTLEKKDLVEKQKIEEKSQIQEPQPQSTQNNNIQQNNNQIIQNQTQQNTQKAEEQKIEDPKKRLYNSVDINSFFNVNNLKGKEIPKK